MRTIALIIGLGLLVYSNTFRNSFHFDDYRDIISNPAIRDIHNVGAIWDYWPTRFINNLSLALNYHWGGLDVTGYHILSLMLHLACALLVWQLTSLTMRALSVDRPWAALFAGAVFLAHPLQTQAVNYLTQRAVLWAAFFYLASLALYVKARLTGAKLPYIASFLAGTLSMFCKETTITLPFMVCFYEFYFLRNKDSWRSAGPFLLLVAVIPLTWLRLHMVDFAGMGKTVQEAYAGGVTSWQYFLTQLKVLVTYLRLLVLPVHQSVDYDYALARSFTEIPVMFSAGILVLVMGMAMPLRKKYPMAAFGIFWFFITLLPESSFWPNKDVIFEHRLYLPMAGFSFFLAGHWLNKRTGALVLRIFAVVIAVYGGLAYQRNAVWKDELTLWDDAARKFPQDQRAYLNRGAAHQSRGELDLAMADYNMVIGLGPVTAVTLSNRGEIFRLQGDLEHALANFDLAVKINPSYVGTYINRALLYEQKGEFDKAIADLDKAIELKPDEIGAHRSRDRVYHKKGGFDHGEISM